MMLCSRAKAYSSRPWESASVASSTNVMSFASFQPIVDLRTQKIFAYEALARTKAPEFDGPMQLFAAAVAENADRRARPAAARDRRSRAARRTRCSSTSIPPSSTRSGSSSPTIRSSSTPRTSTSRSPRPCRCRTSACAETCSNEVRGRGVHLVVDDLGAGYSNLKYIADLHPRVVKLDRDLIAGLTQGLAPVQARRRRSCGCAASSTRRSSPRASRPRPSSRR